MNFSASMTIDGGGVTYPNPWVYWLVIFRSRVISRACARTNSSYNSKALLITFHLCGNKINYRKAPAIENVYASALLRGK